MRKLKASIFTVGWLSTKALIGPDAHIMMATAMTIAATMISTCCTSPTAVMTESKENTMSMIAICAITPAKLGSTAPCSPASSPSKELCTSLVALAIRKAPPSSRIRSRAEMSLPKTENRLSVSDIIQARESKSSMRVVMAAARPIWRPFAR